MKSISVTEYLNYETGICELCREVFIMSHYWDWIFVASLSLPFCIIIIVITIFLVVPNSCYGYYYYCMIFQESSLKARE